jgi:hypothetical protein
MLVSSCGNEQSETGYHWSWLFEWPRPHMAHTHIHMLSHMDEQAVMALQSSNHTAIHLQVIAIQRHKPHMHATHMHATGKHPTLHAAIARYSKYEPSTTPGRCGVRTSGWHSSSTPQCVAGRRMGHHAAFLLAGLKPQKRDTQCNSEEKKRKTCARPLECPIINADYERTDKPEGKEREIKARSRHRAPPSRGRSAYL